MKITDCFFSETNALKRREAAGLHIIDEMQRFRMLVNCLFCSMGVSLVYTFELFTTEFSQRYQLSAGDLSTISTVGVAFCYFVVPYALLFEKVGPAPLLWWGCLCAFIGCLGLNLILLDIIQGNLVVICIFYAFMNTAAGMFDATSIVTLVETFPRNRGLIIALAKVMTGLGSSVLSSVSTNLFGPNISGYLFFVMAFAMVVAFAGSFVLHLPPYVLNWWRRRGKTEVEVAQLEALISVYNGKSVPTRRLMVGYVVAVALIIFTAITAPVVAYVRVSVVSQRVIGSLIVAITCCFFVMMLPIRWLGGIDEPSPSALARAQQEADGAHPRPEGTHDDDDRDREGIEQLSIFRRNAKREDDAQDDEEDEEDISTRKSGNVEVPHKMRSKKNSKRVTEGDVASVEPAQDSSLDDCGTATNTEDRAFFDNFFTEYVVDVEPRYVDPVYPGDIVSALKRPDLYLILLGFILQGAIGVMVIYNSGTIYVATSGEPRSVGVSALYTAFLGVGSALGRIAVGAYEAYVQSQPKEHRRFLITMALPIPPLIGVVAGILILVVPGAALLFPFILVYFKEGAFYSTCAIIFPALYATHHAIYYNLSSATTVVCVICFNRFLFGFLVDKQHDALGYVHGEECAQRVCVRTPLIIATVLSAVAAVTLGTVHFRYKRHVRRTVRMMNGESADDAASADVLELDDVQ